MEKVKDKINKAGHQVDDWVETAAEKHHFPKWKVWLGLGLAALAVVGAVKLFGVI